MMRLRQAVLVARDLEPAAGRLRDALRLGEPFADPGVGAFGLRNAVFAVGGDFLEVVAPAGPGTAAGRHLERRGEGGYMLIVQVDDIDAARSRADGLGLRRVWETDLEDIRATHLHPADVGGTILSVDQPVPPESWRWGGPDWHGRAVPGRLLGATLEVPDPDAVSTRWAGLLGLEPATVLELPDGQRIGFGQGDAGLVEVVLEVAGDASRSVPFGAASIRMEAMSP